MRNFNIIILLFIPFVFTACAYSEKIDDNGNFSGEGGSLAKFTVLDNYLYTVDQSSIHTFNINEVEHPQSVSQYPIGIYTETIFPYEGKLLLGTEAGMFVYELSNPANPHQITYFQHIRSCDPVVAQNGYAYITLNTSNQRCFNGSNELQIIDIKNIYQPLFIKSFGLTTPLGLDIQNDTLFVCDGGLRILNVADKLNPVELAHFYNIPAQDVIYKQGRLVVTGTDGIRQYEQNGGNYQLISFIPIQP